MNNDDLFSLYFEYFKGTEVPPFLDRWCILIGLGAMLGRRVWIRHFGNNIYPNMYCLFVGRPGARKSTAIKRLKKLWLKLQYDKFSAQKTSKEKFLLDLAGIEIADNEKKINGNGYEFLDTAFGSYNEDHEMFIACDEFSEFFAANISDFTSMLGDLYDYDGIYRNSVKNGVSVEINNPTISLLGGITPVQLADKFPPTVVGQGFFSRLILVYCESTGERITNGPEPSEEVFNKLQKKLLHIQATCTGPLIIGNDEWGLIDAIYKTTKPLEDVRFDHYSQRRIIHLFKLILLHTVARGSMTVTKRDIVYANTVLSHTEHFMPRALGAFGQAKNNLLRYNILQAVDNSTTGLNFIELWEAVQSEAKDINELTECLRSLTMANRIQNVDGRILSKKKILNTSYVDNYIDYRMLTNEEKSYI